MPNDPSPFVVAEGTTQSRRESHCGAQQPVWLIVPDAGPATAAAAAGRCGGVRPVDASAAALTPTRECPASGAALLQHAQPVPAAVREWPADDGRSAVVE